jgi:hypothetical protein
LILYDPLRLHDLCVYLLDDFLLRKYAPANYLAKMLNEKHTSQADRLEMRIPSD